MKTLFSSLLFFFSSFLFVMNEHGTARKSVGKTRWAPKTDRSHVLQRPLLHALFFKRHLTTADDLLDDLVIDAALF